MNRGRSDLIDSYPAGSERGEVTLVTRSQERGDTNEAIKVRNRVIAPIAGLSRAYSADRRSHCCGRRYELRNNSALGAAAGPFPASAGSPGVLNARNLAGPEI